MVREMSREFLVFRLCGPMAAFGEITVGEQRSLWDAPSKSGILGLLAACLGLDRDQLDALNQLDQGLGFAVRLDNPGFPLRDYHTAQAPTEAARKRREKAGLDILTRKGDLEADDLNTVLSERMYRLEWAATIALWNKSGDLDLNRLATALNRPVYTPYLGRKACPLSAPPRPHLVATNGLLAALDRYDALEVEGRLLNKTRTPDKARVWFECDAGLSAEEEQAREIRLRRDGLRNRARWQFCDRREGRLEWHNTPVGTPAEV